jgi:LuxR family transcriptional activator of conjugal transfer of Ti plasmids
MEQMLRALLDAIDAACDAETIVKVLTAFALDCGFESFAYFEIQGSDVRTISNLSVDWQRAYLDDRLASVDPVITRAKRLFEVFAWSADEWLHRASSSEERRYCSLARTFGIRSGVSIPVEASFGKTLILSFTSSGSRQPQIPFPDQVRATQAVLAIHYRLRALAVRALMAPSSMLSPKEVVALTWAAKGKYTHEIAQLMNIQARTVQHYLDNARRKLDAITVPQLVSIAKDRGLI